MAETTALIELKKVVDRFIFKYKLPDSDFVNYLEHAGDCVRALSVHAFESYNQTTESLDALGVLTMPTDMLSLIGVALSYKGELWYFTEKKYMVIKLTAADLLPSNYDSTWSTYGSVGGENQYYFRVDWKGRKIHIDGAESLDVQLQYISSGLDLAAPTTVPAVSTPTIDAYLRWAQGEIEGKSINEQLKRNKRYEEQFRLLKLLSLPALREIKDYFLSMTTQAAQR